MIDSVQPTSLHSRIEGISDADPPQGENDTDETRLLSNDGCYEETNEVAMTTSNTTSIMANGSGREGGRGGEIGGIKRGGGGENEGINGGGGHIVTATVPF